MSFFSKLFGDPNAKAVRALQPLVDAVNGHETAIRALSDDQLKAKTEEFRKRIGDKPLAISNTLDEILPEAFAAVREAARRVLGQRHFDVQIMGGVVLHQGGIAEMRTGEGKTLTSTLPVYLNALAGRGVHVVTVNDYLAKRDAAWMGRVYHSLGLSVGAIQQSASFLFDPAAEGGLRQTNRKEAYAADITYGTNNEYGFDYLRDNMATHSDQMVQMRGQTLNSTQTNAEEAGLRWSASSQRMSAFYYAIIDEVDSILIDEARTPLIISAPAEESTDQYRQFAQIARQLVKDADYNIDEKMRAATLTEAGVAKVEKMLGVENLYAEGGMAMVHHIEQALRAETLYQKDRDYVVKDNEVIIVDEFTGRLMFGRRYSEGLHQAIEAKEGVKVQRESDTLATITFQNYFRLYEKLSGMTGTAASEAEELHRIYKLDVTVIPTHRPMIREDRPDRIYKTEQGKFQAVVEEVKRVHETGQPILLGTVSIEKNEQLSHLLELQGVPHAVLNAKQHEKEAKILADAGSKGAVTVATNMAGRGVDIILGGAPPDPGQAIEGESRTKEEWQAEHDAVVALGGLFVIGTERHEARRIDNQLRGRSGRQGDPGASQFYLSLDDDLMRIFGSNRMKSMMTRLGVPDDMPIEHKMISKGIENAQVKVEGHHFDIRKHLLEYDDVLNKHRETIYGRRRAVLTWGSDRKGKEEIFTLVEEEIESVVAFHTPDDREWNVKEVLEVAKTIYPLSESVKAAVEQRASNAVSHPEDLAKARGEIMDLLKQGACDAYAELEKRIGNVELMMEIERNMMFRAIDTLWVEHLDAMTRLRQGIGLRGYGQRDPLVEYKREAFRMFRELLATIRQEVVYSIFKVGAAYEQARSLMDRQGVSVSAPAKSANDPLSSTGEGRGEVSAKVGRNEPCPCGSGKKYKRCHGG